MKILLIDDHILFRQGLKFLLSDLDQTVEFLETDRCSEVGLLAAEEEVDIVLLDLHLPDSGGVEALHFVRDSLPASRIVVLSSEDDPHIIRNVVDEGAAGFIPKSSTQEMLIAALRLILAGGVYLPAHVLQTAQIEARVPGNESLDTQLGELTERQREVLARAVQGKANKVIARELDISEATVKAHLSACFRALGVKNRTEAVFIAASAGLTH